MLKFIMLVIALVILSLGVFLYAKVNYCNSLVKTQEMKRMEYAGDSFDTCMKAYGNTKECAENAVRSKKFMEKFDRAVLKYENCYFY